MLVEGSCDGVLFDGVRFELVTQTTLAAALAGVGSVGRMGG